MAICEYVSPEEQERITELVSEASCRGASPEELDAIDGRLPVLPYLAKLYKEYHGLQALLDTDWNLYDAVQEYGPDFLTQEEPKWIKRHNLAPAI